MISDGIKAVKELTTNGIKTNCTWVFSVGQTLLSAKAGATYVSPFLDRLDGISTGLGRIEEIKTIYENDGFQTEILAASNRRPMHIVNCAKLGADVITAPLAAVTALLNHPLTAIGLAKIIEDSKKL